MKGLRMFSKSSQFEKAATPLPRAPASLHQSPSCTHTWPHRRRFQLAHGTTGPRTRAPDLPVLQRTQKPFLICYFKTQSWLSHSWAVSSGRLSLSSEKCKAESRRRKNRRRIRNRLILRRYVGREIGPEDVVRSEVLIPGLPLTSLLMLTLFAHMPGEENEPWTPRSCLVSQICL